MENSELDLWNLKHKAKELLEFIEHKWSELQADSINGHKESLLEWRTCAALSNDGHLDDYDHQHPYIFYLPNKFISPGGRFNVQFYWDSFFIVKSLLQADKFTLAKGMVENCFYSVEKHGMVNCKQEAMGRGFTITVSRADD